MTDDDTDRRDGIDEEESHDAARKPAAPDGSNFVRLGQIILNAQLGTVVMRPVDGWCLGGN